MKDRMPSVLIGAGLYTVLGLLTAVLAVRGGQAGQMASSALCCLLAIGIPMIAVWHHTSTNRVTISMGAGAGMGALAMLIGGLGSTALQKVLQTVGALPSDAELVERARRDLLDSGMDPAAIDQALGMTEMMQGPLGIVSSILIVAVVGAIGGLIGAALFKKGNTDAELYG
jgi:hypothetical protein